MHLRPIIPPDAPPHVRGSDLARWFGVNPRTILRWAARGLLPEPTRLSKRTFRFDTQAVRAALARRAELATTRSEEGSHVTA